jgi:hypothetical protein
MRKLSGFVAVAALAVSAQARAAAVPFTGALTVQITFPPYNTTALAPLPPITALGAGTATVNGSGPLGHLDSIGLAGGTFATAVSVPVTDFAAAPIVGLKANTKNGPASFTTGFGIGGLMPVIGTATVCTLGGPRCTINGANLVIPFTSGGVNGVGLGGAPITSTFFLNITVTGAPWTTGTVTTMTTMGGALSQSGFIHGPASGGASSAAAASGVVQLVTPVQINTNFPQWSAVAAFGILELHFVPEPGTLLLVASGVAALGLLGRRMSK